MRVTEYYCDRCRRQLPSETVLSLLELRKQIAGDAPRGIRKELCDTCVVQLEKWLETMPTEEK